MKLGMTKTRILILAIMLALILANCTPLRPPVNVVLVTSTLPNTDKVAVTNSNSRCRSGPSLSYNTLSLIPSFELVLVIGRNETGDWLLVRWAGGFSSDCWIMAELLKLNFDFALISVVATPLPPTAVSILSPTRTSKTPSTPTSLSLTPLVATNTPLPSITDTPIATPTMPAGGKLVLGDLTIGSYSIEAPEQIMLGESRTIYVQVLLADDFLRQIRDSEANNASQNVSYVIGDAKNILPRLSANLVSTNFEINEITALQKSLLSNTEFTWTWNISPKSGGNQIISLAFTMPIKDYTGGSEETLSTQSIGIDVVEPIYTPIPRSQRLEDAFIEKFPDMIGYVLSFVAAILVLFFKDEVAHRRKAKQETSKGADIKISKQSKRKAKFSKTNK